jgi:hypothetical protein
MTAAVLVMLVMPAMAGPRQRATARPGRCTAPPHARATRPQDTGGSISSGADAHDRGLRLDPGRLAFHHALQVRGSKNGVARELCDGDTLTTGDRIRLSVAHVAHATPPSP